MFWGDIIKSLFKAVAILSIFSVATKFLGFLFRLYLSRVLPTDVLGMYTIALSVASVFITIVGAGMPLTISKEVAGNIVDGKKQKSHASVTAGLIWCVGLSIIITLFVLLGGSVFDAIFTDYDSYIILLTMLPTVLFTALYTPFKGYLWGEERYTEVSLVELIEQIIRVITCIILFALFKNISILLPAGIGLSVACVISTIVGIVIYYRVGGRLSSPKGQFVNVIKSCVPLTGMRVASSMMTPIINIILPFQLLSAGFTNNQALSLIGIVMGMTIPLLFAPSAIIGSIGMALIPKLSTLQRENNNLALRNQINSSLTFTTFACVLFVPIFGALGEPICVLLFDNAQAGIYLTQFAWLIVPIGLSQITSSILNSLGYETKSFIYFIISSVGTLILVAILPQFVGISALLIAMGVGNALVFVLNLIKINKVTHLNSPYISKILIMLAVSIPIALFTKWTFNILLFIFPNIVCIVLCCLLCVIALGLLLTSFNLIDIEIITNIVQKVRKRRIKQ